MLFLCGACTWNPASQETAHLGSEVASSWSVPTASCATEEPLDYAALLWREFVVLGDHGSMWPEYVALTDQLQEACRKLTLERLRTFASVTLRSALATLTRWRTWFHDAACTGPPTPGGAVSAELTGLGGTRRPFAGWSPIWARLPHCGSLSEGLERCG